MISDVIQKAVENICKSIEKLRDTKNQLVLLHTPYEVCMNRHISGNKIIFTITIEKLDTQDTRIFARLHTSYIHQAQGIKGEDFLTPATVEMNMVESDIKCFPVEVIQEASLIMTTTLMKLSELSPGKCCA